MRSIVILFLFFSAPSYCQYDEQEIVNLRQEHLDELTDTTSHILNMEEIKDFQGLDYFDIDSTYAIQCRVKRRYGKPFEMITTTERRPIYRRYGYALFKLNSVKCKLEVYQPVIDAKRKEYGDYLFIPFRDQTSANESYGGGRYLDLEIPTSKSVTIDFNLSYNPYCAYSHRYSCPVPPVQNTLRIKVEAGEKTPLVH